MFESVALPPDTVLLPGVISHATNIVEHPETIADRIIRFAERVGRENVVASADCGFSCQASYTPETTRGSSGRSSRPWPKEPAFGPPTPTVTRPSTASRPPSSAAV